MNEPSAPQTSLPGYNRTQHRPKWFNPFRVPEEEEGYYTAFWPFLIFFIAYGVHLIFDVSLQRYRELTLTNQINHLAPLVQKANEQDDFIQSLRKDLQSLAPMHPGAAMIRNKFFPEGIPSSDNNFTPAPQK